MDYMIQATSDTPALIVYLIDVSGSMNGSCGDGQKRIDVVAKSLQNAYNAMIGRSRTGFAVNARYAVAMYAYNGKVVDLLKGVKPIDELAQQGIPSLPEPSGTTNPVPAFEEAHKLLNKYISRLDDCPAPLVCHLTDAEFGNPANASINASINDLTRIVQEIMAMRNSDGNVLVENIFIGEQLLHEKIVDPRSWPGVADSNQIKDGHVRTLWDMSSPLPESMSAMMSENGYAMQAGVKMLIPAETPDLVELAFVMSSSTGGGISAAGYKE